MLQRQSIRVVSLALLDLFEAKCTCHHVHGSLEVKQTDKAQKVIIASAACITTTKATNQASRAFHM